MVNQHPDYLSYLLRMWQDGDEAKPAWRMSLENAQTGERHNFATIEELFAFLRKQTGVSKQAVTITISID